MYNLLAIKLHCDIMSHPHSGPCFSCHCVEVTEKQTWRMM